MVVPPVQLHSLTSPSGVRLLVRSRAILGLLQNWLIIRVPPNTRGMPTTPARRVRVKTPSRSRPIPFVPVGPAVNRLGIKNKWVAQEIPAAHDRFFLAVTCVGPKDEELVDCDS